MSPLIGGQLRLRNGDLLRGIRRVLTGLRLAVGQRLLRRIEQTALRCGILISLGLHVRQRLLRVSYRDCGLRLTKIELRKLLRR